ncbi:DNA repair protein RecO [Frigoriglobus tundricola]|uniref:DNA repair protein RecO n=1 Tax=Frigoriglobus tundricola TaxID=2774151 RepID=A0A6M5Z481_9BACT|nr:DNA repair protein RecO [Frigoriglobus tundricola]QJX00272.1 DNA recombination and repair protein RecO [Frigoriglobus tundricola]
MAAERALAIVVRGTDWSETSRITTLFTREFGKVRALAKGGRRLKSNFDVAFDLLTVCQIMFLRKASGGLDLLTEARLEEQFPALRQNLPALYAGYYVAELLADGTQDYDPHVPLFDAAVETLRALGSPTPPAPLPEGKGESGRVASTDLPDASKFRRSVSPPFREAPGVGSSTAGAVSAFELVWLHELGYSPRLDACAGCGIERVNPSAAALYSPSAGGVLCPQCGPAVADRRGASGAALSALRALGAGGAGPELAPAVRTEVRHLLGPTVSCVLGRRPRLLGYVDGG